MQIGSRPLPIDNKEKGTCHRLIVEQEAMKRENTPSAKAEAEKLEGRIAQIKEELAVLKQQWEQEKKLIESLKREKNQLRTIAISRRRS